MTAMGDILNQVVPTLVRVARRPGAVLLAFAAAGVAIFAVLGVVHALVLDGWGSWVPLVLAGVLALPVALLAVRRWRLQRQTADLHLHRTVGPGGHEIVVVDGEPVRNRVQEEVDALNEALTETTVRTARFLPRVEAAQRAALRAAGGPVQAPYLRDDLRVTIVALLGTIAAIPLAAVGSVVTALLIITA